MKGLVKVTPNSLIQITSKCFDVIRAFDIDNYKETDFKWSWKKFKKVECVVYKGLPFWYQYKFSLMEHLHILHGIACYSKNTGDEIWFSQLSYTHLNLMRDGNNDANPIYILNY